jgi:hypothetical protein
MSHAAEKNTFSYPGILLAQDDSEDGYDPFADYSEYDTSAEEEADIQFFRHGRLLSVGLGIGSRGFTQNLQKLYGGGATFGAFMAFFFDMRMAFQLGFLTGDQAFEFRSPTTRLTGSVSLTFLSFALKYYFNTQNLTRGFSELNPYLIGGASQIYRAYTIPDSTVEAQRVSVFGADFGGGIEIPINRNKSFLGLQVTYHYVDFKDESIAFLMPDLQRTGPIPAGDTYDILAILGFNF